MSYDLTRITGTARTRTPIVRAGSFTTKEDARRVATMRERRFAEDDPSFRETRQLMRATHGICG